MSGAVSTTTTAVPQPAFGDTGFVAPAESAILAGRLADINAAFGGNLSIQKADGSLNLSTPQGQLASSETAIIGDINSLFMALANGVDPAYASGRMTKRLPSGWSRVTDTVTSPTLATGTHGTRVCSPTLKQADVHFPLKRPFARRHRTSTRSASYARTKVTRSASASVTGLSAACTVIVGRTDLGGPRRATAFLALGRRRRIRMLPEFGVASFQPV